MQMIPCYPRDAMKLNLRQNGGKTDGWVLAAMATPDVTHPCGLWAGHAPCSAEALSFVSLSVYACAVGVEGGGRRGCDRRNSAVDGKGPGGEGRTVMVPLEGLKECDFLPK